MPTQTDCPATEVLQRLLLGQVGHDEADTLEMHVQCCATCAHALQGLHAEDGLVAAMREARTLPPSDAADAMIPWLKRLRPKDPTQTLAVRDATQQTPDPLTPLPMFDFLAEPEAADELGRLGKYRILQSIGVGGMGMVFLAEDQKLHRLVALKVIKPELLQREDLHERFLSEARAIAAVEHDNIVAIYEADDVAGVPYLVMPLLFGESLEDYLRKNDEPLPIDEILGIGREIAAGLGAAHASGMIHRDIKPSNIWLEEKFRAETETTAQGKEADPQSSISLSPDKRRVKILDFGLARSIEGVDEEGQQRSILGTPAYMSPEQGRCLPVDARADLFSLGCVMYRMAAGRMPFQGKDIVTTLLSVATQDPPDLKKLNPKLPVDLVRLIEKLLAKKPTNRYGSAQEVVEAIRQIERQRQPKSWGRWVLLTAACVVLVVTGAIAGTLAWSTNENVPLPPEPCEITFSYDEPDTTLILHHGDGSELEVDVRRTPRLMLLPGDYTVRPKNSYLHRKLSPGSFAVNAQAPKVVLLRLVGLVRPYYGHSQTVTSVAFSPGKDSFMALSGSMDMDLRLWDTRGDNAGIRLLGQRSPAHCVAFSPDGKQAISGSGKKLPREPDIYVRVWNLETLACGAALPGHQSSVISVAYDPKGKTFLSGDMSGDIIFWNVHKGEALERTDKHDRSGVKGLAYLPDGLRALSCDIDGRLLLWDVAKRVVVKVLAEHKEIGPLHKGSLTCVSASPDGKHAATASTDGSIHIWNLQSGECERVLKKHERAVLSVAYSPDGKRLLSGGWDKILRLWNAETGELIDAFTGHSGAIHSVAFASDGRRALSGGSDLTMCLWELPR